MVPQGIINPIPANPSDYVRIVTDHIGNKIYRNSTLFQIQTTEGYIQGSTSNSSALPFRYNGKEFIAMNGLNWYDYGARFYDPQIGRFTTVDPLAEIFNIRSPYS